MNKAEVSKWIYRAMLAAQRQEIDDGRLIAPLRLKEFWPPGTSYSWKQLGISQGKVIVVKVPAGTRGSAQEFTIRVDSPKGGRR